MKSDLVTAMHNRYIGSLYRQRWQRHGHCPILRNTVNRASMIFNFSSWVIYILIGCSHPLMRYWQCLGGMTTATRSLPHLECEHQRSVDIFGCSILGNEGIVWIFELKTELSTALMGKNAKYTRRNTDSSIIDITICKTCKKWLLHDE